MAHFRMPFRATDLEYSVDYVDAEDHSFFDNRSMLDSVDRRTYRITKSSVDLVLTFLALPILISFGVLLLFLNPILNPGPLLFRQERMGKGGRRFWLLKFRTMRPSKQLVRRPGDPLETHRITKFGQFLRSTRLDELPNFVNVLLGDMSIVGPRPDAWSHACEYIESIPYYRERFRVRPGITGLAQINVGYAECDAANRRKAEADHRYVMTASLRGDLNIMISTIGVMLSRSGAK